MECSGHDVEKPEDLTARSGMLLASTLAGIAFGKTGTAATHSIGHALATIADIPHGRTVAIGLHAILAWSAEGSPEPFAAVAEALRSQREADAAAPAFRTLMEETGTDRSLVDKKINPAALPEYPNFQTTLDRRPAHHRRLLDYRWREGSSRRWEDWQPVLAAS